MYKGRKPSSKRAFRLGCAGLVGLVPHGCISGPLTRMVISFFIGCGIRCINCQL